MARGRDAHRARQAELAALGKDLSRRARSKCELCLESAPLTPTPLFPEEPYELDGTLLLCERCGTLLGSGRHEGAETLRFLETAIWSELRPAQVAAVHVLERLAGEDEAGWAREAADTLWLDAEVRELVDRMP
jgi:protein PhnA